jgi:hypothetical protein
MTRQPGWRLAALALGLALLTAACSSAPLAMTAVRPSIDGGTPAAATPTATATSGPPLRLEGEFSTTPDHGPLGSNFTAQGSGMTPSTQYTLTWTSVDGSWQLSDDRTQYQGRKFTPTEVTLAQVTTDAQGNFQTTATVPDPDFGFEHDVRVMRNGEIHNQAAFNVDIQATIDPTSGPAGTPITVTVEGIGWKSLEASWRLSYDNAYTGWLSAITTEGVARATIPATGVAGVHVLAITQGVPTFAYLNPQQSPDPSVPILRIPFTLTDGPAVLPPDATTQGLAVPASNPPAQAGPAIWTNPPAGTVGSPVTLHGSGLSPNTAFDLSWTTISGSRVAGPGIQGVSNSLGTATTDAQGNLNWLFAVPDDVGGVHTITAGVADQPVAQASLTVLPSAAALSVDRGPSGTDFTIHLKGVGWTDTANIYNVVWDNGYTGFACGVNSAGDVQVTLPAAGAPGWHFIDLYPGIYKGKEASSLDLDFRIPQLTYADDHPGEKLPAFHFAFLITPPEDAGPSS